MESMSKRNIKARSLRVRPFGRIEKSREKISRLAYARSRRTGTDAKEE